MVRIARFEKVSVKQFVSDWIATFPQQMLGKLFLCLDLIFFYQFQYFCLSA